MNIERLKREFIFETFEDAFDIHKKYLRKLDKMALYLMQN